MRRADHDCRRVIGRKGRDGVLERLALVDGGARGLDADDVGREPLGSELEGGDRPAAERRNLLDVAAADLGEALRPVQDPLDLLAGKVLDSQQVLHDSSLAAAVAAGVIATSSVRSVSSSLTL